MTAGERSLARGVKRRSGVAMMMRSKFSPREIVQRLQMIETLTAGGLPVAEALRTVGMREAEYDRWRLRPQRPGADAWSVAVPCAEAREEDAPCSFRATAQTALVTRL